MLEDSIQSIITAVVEKSDCLADFNNIKNISDFVQILLRDKAWIQIMEMKKND